MRIYLSFALAALFMASAVSAEKCGPLHGCAPTPQKTTVSDHCKKAAKKIVAAPAAACDCAHFEKAAADISPRVDVSAVEPIYRAQMPVFDTTIATPLISQSVLQAPPDRDGIYLRQHRLLI
ncbi:hypothetical protein [Turneriella parva]|uniref:Lipoprotein n=1 Tax=Turneriella parva (strain ATCC BAA-1111 / DSM 21527 / NCTC 11395 / H) TaxID=869212 RepID=I4B6N9_TURPD|nr:hypothetical protein [Turneriella parva]AFM12946.1 hypothetical protein Turpa_2301 [Turneriella parva DSM 21527]